MLWMLAAHGGPDLTPIADTVPRERARARAAAAFFVPWVNHRKALHAARLSVQPVLEDSAGDRAVTVIQSLNLGTVTLALCECVLAE